MAAWASRIGRRAEDVMVGAGPAEALAKREPPNRSRNDTDSARRPMAHCWERFTTVGHAVQR